VSTIPPEATPYLDEWLGAGWSARPLAGDASVRAYYRITAVDGRTYMLAWYPEEVRAQLARFLAAYEVVAPHGRLPEVLRSCEVAVLQSDVGDRTLYDVLHENRAEGIRLYRAAIGLLVAFQAAPDAGLNAPFTAGFFSSELQMAREFYVEQLMGGDGAELEPLMKTICDNVARHPYRLCHRDFHGQNIHVVNDTLYLIDYQDLRMGPDTYDLASLLRDRGVARLLGDQTELELIEHYSRAQGAGGGGQENGPDDPLRPAPCPPRPDELPDFRRRYFETLLQRSIKILGTFARQPIVRGRMHYLDFIPPTLESIARCLEELPEYGALRDMFPLSFDLERARERARELNNTQGAG
jgi:aminoglycoside/choline kinase family phosphotransferase